jgi:hypothetical protein
MSITWPDSADHAIAQFNVSEERFTSHLRTHVNRFFPDLDASTTTVRLTDHAVRRYSQVLQYEVADGTLVRRAIYKIPFSLQDAMTTSTPTEDRPRLFPVVSPVSNGLREHRALESLQQHFASLKDDRFGAISVFELIESPFVVVMEKCPDPDMKSLLKHATRFHRIRNPETMNQAFVNTGAWLREFHKLPALEHTEDRHEDRECFVDSVTRFTEGLSQQTGNRSFFHDISRRLAESARKILPAKLPCAIIHGDFAPRNILIRSDSRVTVFDTQRRWRAPLYEDLAYLLLSIKAPGPQVRSQGVLFKRGQLASWESAFLNGYFANSRIPLAAVRLYECLLTLEWWAAINFRHRDGTLRQRLGVKLSNRYLSRYMQSLLTDIDSVSVMNDSAAL